MQKIKGRLNFQRFSAAPNAERTWTSRGSNFRGIAYKKNEKQYFQTQEMKWSKAP